MLNMFAQKKPPPAGGGTNFDPLTEQYVAASRAQPSGATPRAGGQASSPARDGPLLLRVVDDLAQAALKARNDFLAELNAAESQRRDVHAAARARLEQELSQMATTAAKLSDRLFFATRGVINLARVVPQPVAALPAPPASSAAETRPPQHAAAAPATPHPAADGDAADMEVAAVNSRAGPVVDAAHDELARQREEQAQLRVREREEFETMVAAAAEQRAAAEVQSLRGALERANAQKRQALQELEALSREHSELQQASSRQQPISRAALPEDEEGYGMDSVSVIHASPASTEEGGDAGYANAVKRLEDRVVALSRQLAVEHDARERLEDFLREKGISVDHLRLHTSGLSSELLRTVQKTVRTQLAPNAPLKDVRAALAHVEQRCAEAEEGHSASMMAVDSLMHVINTVSAMDNSNEAAVMQALPTLASLAAKGAAARALLAAGAAAAVAETMLAHASNPGLLCEACTALCVLAGGLLSPLGMSPEAAARERVAREAMCDRVASHAGAALVETGVRHADNQWVTLAVARAIGVIGRGTAAAQRLLDFGVVQVLSRALGRYSADASAYEAAHMSALAMVALAATTAANADSVDRKGGRASLQQSVLVNTTLARALGMEFPQMASWLAGKAFVARKSSFAGAFACGSPRADALLPQAESLWLQAVRDAATRRRQPASQVGTETSSRRSGPPGRAAPSTTSSASSRSKARPAGARPPLGSRPPQPPRKPPPQQLQPAAEEEDDDDEQVLGQL